MVLLSACAGAGEGGKLSAWGASPLLFSGVSSAADLLHLLSRLWSPGAAVWLLFLYAAHPLCPFGASLSSVATEILTDRSK